MIVVKLRHLVEGDDEVDVFLVVNADAFSMDPHQGDVVFLLGDEVALRVRESEYQGHWGPYDAQESNRASARPRRCGAAERPCQMARP